MDDVAKKTGQLNIRIEPEMLDSIEQIESRHHITQTALVRGLLAAAVKFYEAHGWFSFPVEITPTGPDRANLRAIIREEIVNHLSTPKGKKKEQ